MGSPTFSISARMRRLGLMLAGVVVPLGGAQTALAQPDLVINVADSVVRAGSCDRASELASGRIAIKNIGTTQAKMKILERVTRSMLAVYVPENIDMVDKKTKSEQLDIFDQESMAFQVGKGVQKRGRFFGTPPNRVATANLPPTATGNVAGIQKALNELGHNAGPVDGIRGSQTRDAIRRYQQSKGETVTGRLTTRQTARLLSDAGIEVRASTTTGAQGPMLVTLYAAVDPYDLVEESNESNNIVKFTVEIDCSQ